MLLKREIMDVRAVSDPVFHLKPNLTQYFYSIYNWLTLIANSPGSGEEGGGVPSIRSSLMLKNKINDDHSKTITL